MNKNKGSMMDFLSPLLCFLAFTIIVTGFFNVMKTISQKDEVSQVARQYILRMETVGYLTDSDRVSLIHTLADMGVSNIDLTGTTTSDVGYGNPIILNISGTLKMSSLDGSNLTNFVFQETEAPINERRMSTAKN